MKTEKQRPADGTIQSGQGERMTELRAAFGGAEELGTSSRSFGKKIRESEKRFRIWLFLTTKRLLKKPSFVLILLLLPAVLLLYRAVITEDDGKLHISLYFDGNEELKRLYTDKLEEGLPNLFRFTVCASEEDLYSDVAAGRSECGYVISGDTAEKFLTEDRRGLVTAVVSEQTTYVSFINEIVFCRLMKVFGNDIVVQYLTEKSGLTMTRDDYRERLQEEFRKRKQDSEIVEFVYHKKTDNEVIEDGSEVTQNVLTRPIRGTVAIFVLLTGLAGLVFWYQDDAEGRYRVMAREKRPLLSFASILVPTLMAGVMGLLCIAVSGIGTGFFRELYGMLLLVILTAAFCNILRFLIPSVHAVCALIPVLILISYLVCPVILDVVKLFPFVRYVRTVLVPSYYLSLFSGEGALGLPIATAVLCLITVVLYFPEKNR